MNPLLSILMLASLLPADLDPDILFFLKLGVLSVLILVGVCLLIGVMVYLLK